MSRIILNEYTTTPQTPSTNALAIYANNGELHVLNDAGTDITLKSAQLPKSSLVAITGGHATSPGGSWSIQGSGITFVAQTNQYLVTVSNGFTTNGSASTFIGIRVNGVDTTFATYIAGQGTHATILSAVVGTSYTIYQIMRNPTGSTLITAGGFIHVIEVGASL